MRRALPALLRYTLAALALAAGVSLASGLLSGLAGGPQLQLSLAGGQAIEGDPGSPGSLAFTVSLSSPLTDTVRISYTTIDLSAQAGLDYQGLRGWLTFSPAITSQAVTVPLIGDELVESAEQFALRLFEPLSAGLAVTQALATILDDDYALLLPLASQQAALPLSGFFVDAFDNSTGWQVISVGRYSARLSGGEFHLLHADPGYNLRAIAPPGRAQVPAAYAVQALARLEADSDLAARYGLVFDYLDAARFYRFLVDPALRRWLVQKFVNNSYQTLADGSLPDHFAWQGYTRLEVERDLAAIRAYSNGLLLTELNDISYADGRIGLVVVAPSAFTGGAFAGAAFDDFAAQARPHLYQMHFSSSLAAQGWVVVSAGNFTAGVDNGEYLLRHADANFNLRSVAPPPAAALPGNYGLRVRLRLTAASNPAARYGLLFDWLDAARFYRIIIEPADHRLAVQQFASNAYQTLDTAPLPPAFDPFTMALLEIERDGVSIRVSLDNNLMIEAYDGAYQDGQAGLTAIAPLALPPGAVGEAAFDDFVITALP
jgi:hypothetical protein